MSNQRNLAWPNFLESVFLQGKRTVHRILESPRVDLLADGIANRLSILLERDKQVEVPPVAAALAVLDVRTLTHAGQPLLEVSCSSEPLFRHFYHLAHAVAERIASEKVDGTAALERELESFRALLTPETSLSLERQVGLIGELLFMECLLQRLGPSALDAWIGPDGEPHDFRIGPTEFEVKTTRGPTRVHRISSLEQLTVAQSRQLFIASILLEPPGANEGFSLPSIVRGLRSGLAFEAASLEVFEKRLVRSGYRDSEAARYPQRYLLRKPIALVPVNELCPRILRSDLNAALGERAARLEAVSYEVNLEGLEFGLDELIASTGRAHGSSNAN
jgi:hypothetical protein